MILLIFVISNYLTDHVVLPLTVLFCFIFISHLFLM